MEIGPVLGSYTYCGIVLALRVAHDVEFRRHNDKLCVYRSTGCIDVDVELPKEMQVGTNDELKDPRNSSRKNDDSVAVSGTKKLILAAQKVAVTRVCMCANSVNAQDMRDSSYGVEAISLADSRICAIPVGL